MAIARELKVIRDGNLEAAFDAGFAQISAREYARELRARGASPIHGLVAVFDGKRVWARTAAL